jgi:hypothetical protein
VAAFSKFSLSIVLLVLTEANGQWVHFIINRAAGLRANVRLAHVMDTLGPLTTLPLNERA